MVTFEELKVKYPSAEAGQMGDSPALASELAALTKNGMKTASSGSFTSYQNEKSEPKIWSYTIFPTCFAFVTAVF